jgi:hypothetical protein
MTRALLGLGLDPLPADNFAPSDYRPDQPFLRYRAWSGEARMGLLRRQRSTAPPRAASEALGVSGVRILDGSDPRAEDAAARERLRRIVDEAVLLQDLTLDILAGVRERRSLAELAPPGGALGSRFLALRAAVPEPADAELRAAAQTLREILHHHALMLSCSLALLGDLRPERVSGQIDRIEGLGAPARHLVELQDQLGR